MEKVLGKRKIGHLSYTLLTSDVEVDLSDFTIALSRKDKICMKTQKKKKTCKPGFENVSLDGSCDCIECIVITINCLNHSEYADF